MKYLHGWDDGAYEVWIPDFQYDFGDGGPKPKAQTFLVLMGRRRIEVWGKHPNPPKSRDGGLGKFTDVVRVL